MSRLRLVLFAAAALAAIASCKGSSSKKAAAPEPEATSAAGGRMVLPDDGSLFVIARPDITTMAVPARFNAALPTTLAELSMHQMHPPQTMLRAGLARGDAAVQTRLLTAVQTAAKRGPVPDDLRDYYVELFGYSTDAPACAWLRAQVPAAAPAVRDVLVLPLAKCDDEASLKVLLDAGAPASLVMEWGFQPGATTPLPSDPRIVAAALATAQTAEPFEVRKIGFVLSRLGDGAVPAVQKLQAQLADPERRAWVALGLMHHPAASAQAVGRQACKHPAVAQDAMCRDDDDDDASAADKGGDPTKKSLDEQIRYGFDGDELLTRFSRDEVLAGLSRCAGDAQRESYARSACLRELTAIDRAGAAKLAPALDIDDDSVRKLAAQLARFPDVAAIDKRLDALGLTAVAPLDPAKADPIVEVTDALLRRGRMHWFDTETGQFPNEHDELLGELTRLVGPALTGVIFEEVAPRDDDGPYLLRAYAGGKRYEVRAENLGDWYDVGAVLGLLNRLLAERGSDQRYLVLATGDQTAIVVAGPGAALRALVDDGVLDTGAADAGMAAGKAFEDEVFRKLQAEGQDVQRDVPISQ